MGLFQELQQIHKPETIHDSLMLEKQLFEVAQKEWDNMPGPGKSYSAQMDKDVNLKLSLPSVYSLCSQNSPHLMRIPWN